MADIIFDVDGTLMNIKHRRHHVEHPLNKDNDWKAFRAATVNDTPNEDIFDMAKMLHAAGHRILIATARDLTEKAITIKQLMGAGLVFDQIYMRPEKDNRSDSELKSEILDKMIEDGYNPTMVFDDRDQVVSMWRAKGLRVFQVAPGDF